MSRSTAWAGFVLFKVGHEGRYKGIRRHTFVPEDGLALMLPVPLLSPCVECLDYMAFRSFHNEGEILSVHEIPDVRLLFVRELDVVGLVKEPNDVGHFVGVVDVHESRVVQP